MKFRANGRRLFHTKIALVIALWCGLCFAPTSLSRTQRAPLPQSARTIRQESATAELRSTLAGKLRDFTIAVHGHDKQANRFEQESLAREVAAYGEELQADPNNAELHLNLAKARNQLGLLYMSNGEKTKAENEFLSAISADSKFAEAKNNLGVLYAWIGKNAEAAELFRDALGERPNYSEAHLNLGLVLAAEGKYIEAEQQVRLALRPAPNNLSALSALGMLKAKLGRGEAAVEILRKIANLQPDSAAAHSNLGMALAEDGFDLPGALEQFSEAIRLEPQSAPLHYNKGRVLNDLNRAEEARTDLDAACRLWPDNPEALYLLAQVEKQLGNIQRSSEVLDHLVLLEPSNADAQLLLGRNLLSLGKTEEAIHHLQIAVGVNPNNQDALYSLAQALGRIGKPEAKLYMERFQDLKLQVETDDRVQKLGSYGLEAANARDWPQAVARFKEAIDLCGQCASSADLHRNLGLIYVLKGDIESGRNELETALGIKPNDMDARKALESLPPKKTAPR
jgi:tetratricopeptide (TPR) repeat protein